VTPTEILLLIGAGAAAAALIVLALPRQWRPAGKPAMPPSDARILAEHVVDMVSAHDKDGTFRYVSPVFAGMLGEYPGALTGKNPRELAHPDDVKMLDDLWARALGWIEITATTTWRCRQHNGEYVWIETTARAAIGDAAKVGAIICASRDVTERKQLEDALRDSEQRFRTTLETVRLVAVGVDPQGRITFCNDALCVLLGWKRAELIGENWFDKCVPAGEPVRAQFYDRIGSGDVPPRTEHEIVCRDGTRRMIQWDTTVLRTPMKDVLGTASLGADVTQVRQEEATLKLLQSITLAISAAGDLNGALELTLESICKSTGWGYGEAWLPTEEGSHLERMTFHKSAGVEAHALAQAGERLRYAPSEGLPGAAWKSRTAVWVPDLDAIKNDSSLPRVQLALDAGFRASLSLPVISGQEVIAVLLFLMRRPRPTDARYTQMVEVVANQVGAVIERRRAEKLHEAEILRARDEAQAASHAKSDFLSRMSHELRTPLNSVIGFANVLRKNKGARLNQDDLTYLDRIASNGRHLLQLVNNVLDIAKVEAGRLTVTTGLVAVDELLRDVVAQLDGQPRASGVTLKAEVPDDVAPIPSDLVLLRQVLINLAGNALKFTQEGSVVLSAEVDPESGLPIRLHVRDTGIGIPLARQKAIFEPFEQAGPDTHKTYGGTGLGLSISQAICDALGYELTLESEPGRGSTFTVHLEKREDGGADNSRRETAQTVPNSDSPDPANTPVQSTQMKRR
jgi:PAS domain S-box-containing protein